MTVTGGECNQWCAHKSSYVAKFSIVLQYIVRISIFSKTIFFSLFPEIVFHVWSLQCRGDLSSVVRRPLLPLLLLLVLIVFPHSVSPHESRCLVVVLDD
jgi:hypothetical protein